MHKISYAKRWNSDGTCFSQCITITEKEFNFAMQEKSKTVWSDKLENAYLHVQREMENNIYFANLNQFYFIAHILGIFKEKRCLVCRNTCFKIIKEESNARKNY